MCRFKNGLGNEVVYSADDFYDDGELFLSLVANVDNHKNLNKLITELLLEHYTLEDERDDLANDLYRIKELVACHG